MISYYIKITWENNDLQGDKHVEKCRFWKWWIWSKLEYNFAK